MDFLCWNFITDQAVVVIRYKVSPSLHASLFALQDNPITVATESGAFHSKVSIQKMHPSFCTFDKAITQGSGTAIDNYPRPDPSFPSA